jgi:hypothetical protein
VATVGAVVVEDEVAVGSPLDHGEVLELLSQPMDPKGETLHARDLVHIMMHLDVEGLANTFKLSEGTPEQLDGELSKTNRISADGNPTLSTSVVVPGGLPRAIPVSVMPKSIQKDKTKQIKYNI